MTVAIPCKDFESYRTSQRLIVPVPGVCLVNGNFGSTFDETNDGPIDGANNSISFILEDCTGLWGFGERYDALNSVGLERINRVYEHFTQQGADTYMPVPFFMTNNVGVYIDTKRVCTIVSRIVGTSRTIEGPQVFESFQAVQVWISGELAPEDTIYFFEGPPHTALSEFLRLTGHPVLPPKWAFGPWMSANRWNSQAIVEAEAELAQEHGIPVTALVVEAWSDEATFYRFNDENSDNSFTGTATPAIVSSPWPDVPAMIDRLHAKGIHLILWQIPVFKKLEEGRTHALHETDCQYALDHGLIVRRTDGTPYRIPEGRWFAGSYVPDFTNPETCRWWFGKRQYLLDMGVDGFKTDGGEFIYDTDTCFHDGSTGREMMNGYALSYTKAYTQAIGPDRILFSRAGYTGSQTTPMHWAGDQLSIWTELPSVLRAGLTSSLSGILFWGVDIAGFAGPLPEKELYLRAFALATFVPVMQWHSEPVGGQFADILASQDLVNDRSPWHLAKYYQDPEVLSICRKFTTLRMALLDYIYDEAQYSCDNLQPMMRPLCYEYPDDIACASIDDEFLFGRYLLVAPILSASSERDIYLPIGNWISVDDDVSVVGGGIIHCNFDLSRLGLFVKDCEAGRALLEVFHGNY